MRKQLLLITSGILLACSAIAREKKDTTAEELMKMIEYIDSVNSAMKYETGVVTLPSGVAKLKLPPGFKYLNAEQSRYVINKAWGNPERLDVLGMVFPETGAPFSDSSYAFIISYDALGYVKDEDADEIDYSDMLQEIQEGEPEVNKERAAQGYEPIHMVGWAQNPYYDKKNHVLHWAKELKFGTEPDENTLNYDIRVLGRKGVLSFNAVATMSGLQLVKKDIDKVLAMAEFAEGYKYSEFDSNIDEVAAVSIGGLVAGKVLMKAGFFAMILKFWKLIAAGIAGIGYGLKKIFKRKEEEYVYETEQPEPVTKEEETPVV